MHIPFLTICLYTNSLIKMFPQPDYCLGLPYDQKFPKNKLSSAKHNVDLYKSNLVLSSSYE